MCNFIHKRSKQIPERGVGWKIFVKQPVITSFNSRYQARATMLHPLFRGGRYTTNKDGSVSWQNCWSHYGDGFCFFLTKKEAERTLNALQKAHDSGGWCSYSNCIVVKLNYYGGLGQHIEPKVMDRKRFRTAICKRFKIHKDERDSEGRKYQFNTKNYLGVNHV